MQTKSCIHQTIIGLFLSIILLCVGHPFAGPQTSGEAVNPFNINQSPGGNNFSPYTGEAAFSIPLYSLTGRNGLNFQISLRYSSNVERIARACNDIGPTGTVGLGWTLGVGGIICDHKGTVIISDDEYLYVSPGGEGQPILRDGTRYYLKRDPYWKIEASMPTGSSFIVGFKLTSPEGQQYLYGDWSGSSNKATRYTFCNLQTGIVGEKVGSSPVLYPYRWDLQKITDSYGNEVSFGYHQTLEAVSGCDPAVKYTKASYLNKITMPQGDYAEFKLKQKNPQEWFDPRREVAEPDYFMEMYEDSLIDKITIVRTNGTPVKTFTFRYDKFLEIKKDAHYRKSLLTSVGDELEYSSFEYYDDDYVASTGKENSVFNYGALRKYRNPNCGVTEFSYKAVAAKSSWNASPGLGTDISGGGYEEGDFFVDQSHSTIHYVNPLGAAASKILSLPTGYTEKKTIGGDGFVAHLMESSTDYVLQFFRWDGNEWYTDDNTKFSYLKSNETWSAIELFAGKDFLLWKGIRNGSRCLYAYNWVRSDGDHNDGKWHWKLTDLSSFWSSSAQHVNVGSNYFVVNEQEGSRTIRIHTWNGVDWTTLNQTFSFPRDNAMKKITASANTFYAYYKPDRHEYVYAFRWDGQKWSSKFGSNNRAEVKQGKDLRFCPGNNFFVVRQPSCQHITVFNWNGNSWQRTIDNKDVSMCEMEVTTGNDIFAVARSVWALNDGANGRRKLDNIWVYHYNQDTKKWNKTDLGDCGLGRGKGGVHWRWDLPDDWWIAGLFGKDTSGVHVYAWGHLGMPYNVDKNDPKSIAAGPDYLLAASSKRFTGFSWTGDGWRAPASQGTWPTGNWSTDDWKVCKETGRPYSQRYDGCDYEFLNQEDPCRTSRDEECTATELIPASISTGCATIGNIGILILKVTGREVKWEDKEDNSSGKYRPPTYNANFLVHKFRDNAINYAGGSAFAVSSISSTDDATGAENSTDYDYYPSYYNLAQGSLFSEKVASAHENGSFAVQSFTIGHQALCGTPSATNTYAAGTFATDWPVHAPPLSSVSTNWQLRADTEWPHGVWTARPSSRTEVLDGVSRTLTYTYADQLSHPENDNGQPRLVEESIENGAKKRVSYTEYAFENYQGMRDNNFLSAPRKQESYETQYDASGSKDFIRRAAVTEYSNSPSFPNAWASKASWRWTVRCDNSGKPVENLTPFDFSPNASNSKWSKVISVNKIGQYGDVIEQAVPLQRPTCTIFGRRGHLLMATVEGADYSECGIYTGDYDDEDPSYVDIANSWKPGGAVLSSDQPHFGQYSLFIDGSIQGPSKTMNMAEHSDAYTFSAWVRPVEDNATVDLLLTQQSTGTNIHGISDPLSAGKWTYVSKKIIKDQINNWGNFDIRVAPGNAKSFYVDDIRFAPSSAKAVTTYYDNKWELPIAIIRDSTSTASITEYDAHGRIAKTFRLADGIKRLISEKQYYLRCSYEASLPRLTNIIVSNNVDLGFDPEIFSYSSTVPNAIRQVTVTPFAEPGVTVSSGGQIINPGSSITVQLSADGSAAQVIITATAPNGDSQDYTVTFARQVNCWAYEGQPGFSAENAENPLMAIVAGQKVCAIIENKPDGRHLVPWMLSGSTWQSAGNDITENSAGSQSMASQGSNLFVAYAEAFGDPELETDNAKVFIKKWAGSSFVAFPTAGTPVSAGPVTNLSLAIGSDGTPYIAYQGDKNDEDGNPSAPEQDPHVYVKHWNIANSTWEIVGASPASAEGRVYLCFCKFFLS